MLRSVACLVALAFVSCEAAPPLGVRPAKQPSKIASSALALRGGADLGPITPHVAMKMNCVMYVYFVSLFSNLLTFLPNKPFMGGDMYEKFGFEKNEPLRWHLGSKPPQGAPSLSPPVLLSIATLRAVAALTYFGVMLIKDTFYGDRSGA